MKLSHLFVRFFESERSSGILLIVITLLSLGIANSAFAGEYYQHFVHEDFLGRNMEFWVNDGLMTLFFLMVGLEIKREMIVGELKDRKKSLLPFLAAAGGMLVPAFIHLLFNYNTSYISGMGIPMATDIAFSLGILSLLGKSVPVSIKIFLTALAIIDDLGAILVIAIFYTAQFDWIHFLLALGVFGLMLLLQQRKVRTLWPYLCLGLVLWYFMLCSGIHATIAGVLIAFAIPFGKGGKLSPSFHLMRRLHYPVAFGILPLFAFVNTGITIPSHWGGELLSSNSLGIILGLFVGKPLGIWLFSILGIRAGWCQLPRHSNSRHILGVGILGGIGFTMSIFIALLAFSDPAAINSSKIAILIGSLISGVVGYIFLNGVCKKNKKQKN